MISGRRGFLGAIAGTAASALLPRGASAAVLPDATAWSLMTRVLPPETLLPDPAAPDPVAPDPAPSAALLARALAARDAHAARITDPAVIGLVDFAAPSRSPRLHIVDVMGGRVLSSHLVAHGRGSDPANLGWAERFSNRLGSEASCNGSFVIGETYYGRHGRSRRIIGLDPENDQAEARGIVIHAASYVDHAFVNQYGRIGRSQGCFAVGLNEIATVLDQLGPGRLLFAAR
jgi:hypothetical protein